MNDPILMTADPMNREASAAVVGGAFASLSAADLASAERAVTNPELPVMRRTARRLDRLRESDRQAGIHDLTDIVLDDALMTLHLLGDAADAGATTPKIESVTAALVMIGVEPFFARYVDLPVAEDRLQAIPAALAEYERLNRVAARAARLAGAFSGAANDPDVPAIYLAALLHAAPRLMLCVHAPALAVRFRGVPCQKQLAAKVMARWHLPAHMVTLIGGNEERMDPQMHRVRLAVDFAHALESGWSCPDLPGLLRELSVLLGLSLARARQLVKEVRV